MSSPPAQAPVSRGEVLAGRYRVDKILGYGGMGVVARALDLRLDREVAVKVLRPEGADSDDALARFDREARAVSRLRSEHVIRVLDYGKLESGQPFLVMELLVGEDLEVMSTSRYLDPEETAAYVLQACEGLAEAHAHGLVHRDLKPANLFVARWTDGQPLVKVIDFGIAKQIDRRSLVDLTEPLVVMGSSSYLSPEQARGQEAKPASDVWALGVVLYELFTRTRPFVAESVFDIIANILKDEPERPEKHVPGLPKGLADVVMRCLEKDVRKRYADVAELAEALEPFAGAAATGTAARVRRVLETAPGSEATPLAVRFPGAPRSRPGAQAPKASESEPTRTGPVAPGPGRKRVALLALVIAGLLLVALGLPLLAKGRGWPSTTALDARSSGARVAESAPEGGTSELAALPGTTGTPPSSEATAPPTGEPAIALPVAARSTAPGRVTAPRAGRGVAAKGHPTAPAPPPDPVPPPPTAPTTPTSPSPAATTPSPAAPRFVVASAQIQLGAPTNTLGTSPTNVSRLVGAQTARLTACYREALPRMNEPFEGAGKLHLDTDEDGTVVGARLEGPISAPGRCMAAALAGKKVPNVDTGRASADVPVRFLAQ